MTNNQLFKQHKKNMESKLGLIELNKIAIQQMKVLEGVEERRMLK